jgi:hypothetical protein
VARPNTSGKAVRSVLEVRDGLRSVTVVRVGLRSYVIHVFRSAKDRHQLGPAGVPCSRLAAIDRGLEVAEQLGLLDPIVRQRSLCRRALRQTEAQHG